MLFVKLGLLFTACQLAQPLSLGPDLSQSSDERGHQSPAANASLGAPFLPAAKPDIKLTHRLGKKQVVDAQQILSVWLEAVGNIWHTGGGSLLSSGGYAYFDHGRLPGPTLKAIIIENDGPMAIRWQSVGWILLEVLGTQFEDDHREQAFDWQVHDY